MSLTIDLSQELEAELASQAQALDVPTERYLAQIVESAVKRKRAARTLEQSLDEIAARVLPETTTAEMEAALEAALAAVRPKRIWRK